MLKKRILFIAHKPLYPIAGGDQVRMAQQLELLARDNNVKVVCLSHDSRYRPLCREQNPGVEDEVVFYVPLWKRVVQACRTFFNRRPLLVNHFVNRRMMRYVKREAKDFDMVFCASVSSAPYLPDDFAGERIWDITDSLTKNLDNEASAAHGLKRLWFKWQASRMRRYENEMRRRFNATLYISESDRRYVPSAAEVCTRVVPNAVSIPPAHQCALHRPDALGILFVGRMDYAPNILAVTRFCKVILPIIRQSIPKVTFTVAGAFPTPEIVALGRQPDVTVTGFVDSLVPYWQNSALVVAPMFSGSGIQNKILQAMAHGCCVLTTPIGADGLDDCPDTALPRGATPEQLARQAITLLGNPDLRRQTGQEARDIMIQNFSPETVAPLLFTS